MKRKQFLVASLVSLLLFVALAVPGAVHAAEREVVTSPRDARETFNRDDLLQSLKEKGRTQVIVGLQTPGEVEQRGGHAPDHETALTVSARQSRVLKRLEGRNVREVRRLRLHHFMVLNVDSGGLNALLADPEVTSVAVDRPRYPVLYDTPGITRAVNAWTAGIRGSGQVVAVIDSGVDQTHPLLSGKVLAEACFSNPVGTNTSFCPAGAVHSVAPGSGAPCPDYSEGCWHGTHVAGIAVGRDGILGAAAGGMAPDAGIIAIQVFQRSCSTCPIEAYDSDILAALEHVYSLRNTFSIAAVNLSLAGDVLYAAPCDGSYPAFKSIIDNLRDANIATVVSAGNDGNANALAAPACLSNAISVGATTKENAVADFSNSAGFLSLLAPGSMITSSAPRAFASSGLGTASGTSAAAAHVAGAWALLKSANSSSTVSQVLAALQSSGLPITDTRSGVVKPLIQLGDSATQLGALGALLGRNAPPKIALTSPADGATFTAPADISVTAAVGATQAAVSRVEFYSGATKIHEMSGAPYHFIWTAVPPGVYTLTARATDSSGGTVESRPVNISVGSVAPAGQPAQKFTITAGGDIVWVEDALPAGATPSGTAESWNWVSTNPAPFSGSLAHQSALASGIHQHYFNNATAALSVGVGETLYAYVYLDPANPPSEVMLQWYSGGWEHRAYWGANLIAFGTDGTVSRRYIGALPPAGQWVRLEVPAALLGLEGSTVTGMAFTLNGGRATWDQAGKGTAASTFSVSGTVTLSGAGLGSVSMSATGAGTSCSSTNGSGQYSCTVPQGWTGTVTPSLAGYTFTPPSRSYSNVTANQTAQNYTATAVGPTTFQVSGTVTLSGAGLGSVGMAATNGVSCSTTNASGQYSCTVPAGWTGTVTPSLSGYTFTPPSRSYSSVAANQTAQDYAATPLTFAVSGTVTLSGAGLGSVSVAATNGVSCSTTNAAGQYNCTVPLGWTGTVTPLLAGYTFTPLSRSYSSVAANQAAQDYTAAASTDIVWVEDALPSGATPAGTGENWNWVSANPAPFSGALAHQSGLASGLHQHYFSSATATLSAGLGDVLFAYVYLDPANPPTEVMLQWHNDTWEHRAYWGANLIPWGTDGTASRRYMGPLPATGQWVRLEVPAALVGLEGSTVNGMAFTLQDGHATWDYAGKGRPTYHLSGTISVGATALSGVNFTASTGGSCTPSNASGQYSCTVPEGWTGIVTPSLAGYTFTPPSHSYSSVTANQTAQDYTATPITFAVSGTVTLGGAGLGSVSVAATNGVSCSATNASGQYSCTVPYGWMGTVTPSLAGYTFTPPSRSYSSVTANQTAQNYAAAPVTFAVSGTVTLSGAGLGSVSLSATGAGTSCSATNGSGQYSCTVPTGWTGTVTPSLSGYTFTPTSRSYSNVTANQTAQNYTAAAVAPTTFTVSGTVTLSGAGLGSVSLSATGAGTSCSATNGSGQYSCTVPTGWTGTVTPSLSGYTFTPTSRSYSNVTANQTAQNYTAAASTDVVWVEDALPTGATPGSGAEGWNWVSANPTPFSGSLAHQSTLASGIHQHYFNDATAVLSVGVGETLYTYVYLDPMNPPSEVMLQWYTGTWDHRAYWGANLIPWGTDGTANRRYMGALPPAGQWVRLEVPAALVGLEGSTVNGMAFTLYNGRATWDQAGKALAVSTFSVSGTVTLSGVGLGSVSLSATGAGTSCSATNGSGQYSCTVPTGWTGTVTPSLSGYTFTPPSRSYSNVTANQTAQNYTAAAIAPTTFTVSGTVTLSGAGLGSVSLSATGTGTSCSATNGSGQYSCTVPTGWTGTVTPSLSGYTFTPTSRSYSNVTANQTAQNYTAAAVAPTTFTVSGTVTLSGAGLGSVSLSTTGAGTSCSATNGSGQYSCTVPTGWTGSVTPSLPGYSFTPTSRNYTNVTVNQPAQGYTAVVNTDTVWVEDAVPAGATLSSDGGDAWTWVSANPSPFSGNLAHQSNIAAGQHQHYFSNATNTVTVGAGESLFTYVYLDPANPPSEIMLQWHESIGWDHRAYWGANLLAFGTDATASRRYMGALPPVGQWVRLEVPAALVGLEGFTINGMAFVLYNGRATWDRAGKTSAAASSFTVSGTVSTGSGALSGVSFTATGTGASCTASNAAGQYSCTVPQGWTGSVTPSLAGYTFTPPSMSYTNVAVSQSGQNYTAAAVAPVTVSGTVSTGSGALIGVSFAAVGAPAGATCTASDTFGRYSCTVPQGWTGSVTPSSTGYTFTPRSMTYTNVTGNQPGQNYTAAAVAPVTVSGTVSTGSGALSGVSFAAVGTPAGTCTASNALGQYSCTAPSGWTGSVTPSLPGYSFTPTSRNYTNVTVNQPAQGYTAVVNTDTVWVEDAVPAGATLSSDGGDAWTWVSANPSPFSGNLAHQSNIAAGQHQHYFSNATNTLTVGVGESLFAYVYLDPANPPSEIMLQWHESIGWDHRAYWGANLLAFGTDATASRRYMGALPPVGQWVRLEVPAALVGLEGVTLNGMAFALYDGRATWDYTGVIRNVHPGVSLTAPSNNTTYAAPATVTLNATASDNDGTISRVEFYWGAMLLGYASTAPYSFTWTNVPGGSYSLTAKAYDNLGASTVSTPVNITVGTPAGTSGVPDRPTVTGSSSAIVVSWPSVQNATGYSVYASYSASGSSIFRTYSSSSSSITIPVTDFPSQNSLYFSVAAIVNGVELGKSKWAYLLNFDNIDLGIAGQLTIAIADVNNDGCVEVLGTLNDCTGNLLPQPYSSIGLSETVARTYSHGRLADFNGDGILDLIVNGYAEVGDPTSTVFLYYGNGDGTFTKATPAQFPATYGGFGETIVVADFDNDGYLDIFLPNYTDYSPQAHNYLLKNRGDGTFVEISDAAGVALRGWPHEIRVEGAQALDINGDGFLDLYTGSHLYINNGDMTFTDKRALYGLPLYFDEGAKFFDWNNDGYLDLLLFHPSYGPALFQFDGQSFTAVSDAFQNRYYESAFGMNAEDVDGDGFTDVVVAGGKNPDGSNKSATLFLNRNGNYVISNLVAAPSGVGDLWGFADFDKNGTMDMILRSPTTLRYLKNTASDRSSIQVFMYGEGGAQNQHGRTIRAAPQRDSAFVQTRIVDGGSGYLSNNEYGVTFPTPKAGPYWISAQFDNGMVGGWVNPGSIVKIYRDGSFVVTPR